LITGVSKIALPVDDQARGVEVPVPPERQHFGWWALFEDPDGTRYALGRWDGGRSPDRDTASGTGFLRNSH
jgi:hypothetical protein